MKVKIQMYDENKLFENVTKVKNFLALDMFENKIEIYQGKKKTTFKQYEITGYEVKE